MNGGARKAFGVEALLRWTSPDLGNVPPATFVPIAEESGLIVSIGDWVLETACGQVRQWIDRGLGDLHLAVNVSGVQLASAGFFSTVKATLEKTRLAPGALLLELTETTVVNSDDATRRGLEELRAAGVRIVIDDFGMGYSALSYLKSFPVDVLKIDRSFVRGLPDHAGDAAIVAALISLSRGLDLGVVAEGVETEEQLTFLGEKGCDQAQGFLFSRPLPARDLEERHPFGSRP
jgi:EAL domain-containing protein (putative c-di-GMP-specific phosphodiesterase class I)